MIREFNHAPSEGDTAFTLAFPDIPSLSLPNPKPLEPLHLPFRFPELPELPDDCFFPNGEVTSTPGYLPKGPWFVHRPQVPLTLPLASPPKTLHLESSPESSKENYDPISIWREAARYPADLPTVISSSLFTPALMGIPGKCSQGASVLSHLLDGVEQPNNFPQDTREALWERGKTPSGLPRRITTSN